ncbi:hypothetical protein GCM10023206_06930 [Acinetobacter puyangensis]|uniref:Uncharacterized protein n=1 Tax=Acinetobacter puyangensis TaxID=1096779 RepID=A0A240E645_9GAMM|nr:hypothetical protein [Acinetobacter puyangensis]SNX44227.1 hypothetical protein SAMN05421731_102388 [Acinetobacter puyangensis]
MTIAINGTNAFTDLLGDEATEYVLKLGNLASRDILEPLTGLVVGALGQVEFTLTGRLAYEQLLKNIAQINHLHGFSALKLSDVVDVFNIITKFSIESEFSNLDYRSVYHLNPGDTLNCIVRPDSGLTRPVQIKFVEPVSTGLVDSLVNTNFTLQPGQDLVIPFNIKEDIPEGDKAISIVVMRSNDEYGQVAPLGTTRGFTVHSPAIVPAEPILNGAPQMSQVAVASYGINVVWSNMPNNYHFKSIKWTVDNPNFEISIVDQNNLSSIKASLKAGSEVDVGEIITITLEADEYTIKASTEVMS